MKYCTHCGAEVFDEAVVCVRCGCRLENIRQEAGTANNADSGLQTAVKVFLIIGCVFQGWLLIPLAWCLPITISIFHSFRDRRPVSTGMKICTLLFVNLIAGICLLCMHDDDPYNAL